MFNVNGLPGGDLRETDETGEIGDLLTCSMLLSLGFVASCVPTLVTALTMV